MIFGFIMQGTYQNYGSMVKIFLICFKKRFYFRMILCKMNITKAAEFCLYKKKFSLFALPF